MLRAAIPGAVGVEQLDEARYRATIAFGVGWITGRYTAELVLAGMQRPQRLDLSGHSKGAFGKGEARAHVEIAALVAGGSRLDWRYEGTVSGPVAFVGRRLLQVASDLFIQRCFANLSQLIRSSGPRPAARPGCPSP